MVEQLSHENAPVLHKLDLGRHTLFIMSDGTIGLFCNDEQMPCIPDDMMKLDCDETYRLFISLQEQFKQKGNSYEYI